jgi:hypothetical protein
MGKICECTAGGNNLGQAVCDAVLQSWNKTLFKERLNANGTIPKLAFTTTVGAKDLAFWNTYLQASPFRNRYILGDGIDDFEFEHNEREAVETANAVSYKVRDGHIDVTYNVFGSKGASTKLYSKYKALECLNLGINIIDDAGQVAGPVDSADDMLLIPIDSLQVRYGAQQNSGQIAHIIVEFRIPFTFDWGSVRIFQYDKSTDINPLDLRPIVDVNGTLTASAGTTIEATLKLDSSQIGGHPLVGLGLANFTATLNGSSETLVAVTETADGVYSITTTSTLASSDVVALTLVASGFEMPVITATV